MHCLGIGPISSPRPRSVVRDRATGTGLLAVVATLAAVLIPSLTPVHASAGANIGGERLSQSGVVVDVRPGAVAPPHNEAASYVVADLETGEVLAAKSAHERLPPASTLKVLTALTLLPELDKELVVVATDEEMFVEGSKVGIHAGLSYTVDLLFKAMLVDSGNDATHALARVAGGTEQIVAAMNALAVELQALDTTVVNPSGLDDPGQLTSAYDLALIARAALERADFRAYVTTRTADLPARDGTTYQIQNGNRLLGSYEGLIGVKTGFTTLARHTYVGAAEREGRAFVVTVLRTEGRAEAAASALLDWAFLNADAVEPVGELVAPQPVAVVSAPPSAAVSAAPTTQGAPAVPEATYAPAGASGGLGAISVIGLVGVGLASTVAALRLRAVRRERLRRTRARESYVRKHATSATRRP